MPPPESVLARLALVEEATRDSAAVRERSLRNQFDITELREDLFDEVRELRADIAVVRDEVRSMYRAFVTASITFVFSAAGIVTTLVVLFKK